MIERFAALVPRHLLRQSGEVFYAGREAFRTRGGLYVLGFNPGGNPDAETRLIGRRIDEVVATKRPWSAYRDEAWRDHEEGERPFQERVTYLLKRLNAKARRTPSSNLIFVRSARTSQLANARSLEEACWPFHQAVIDQLKPRAIICLGINTGRRVRARVGATEWITTFKETNQRGWKSHAHRTVSGLIVLSLTHPGIVKWTEADSDPSPMARAVLGIR